MNKNDKSIAQLRLVAGVEGAATRKRATFGLHLGRRKFLLGRNGSVLAAELALSVCSYLLSVWILHRGLRWNFSAWAPAMPIVVGFRLLGLYAVGTYKSSLTHGGYYDLVQIMKACAISSVLAFASIQVFAGGAGLPLALFILDWALFQFFLGGLHFGKPFVRSLDSLKRPTAKRVLIVGAGDAGTSVIKGLVGDSNADCRPVGILDDDPQTHGSTICGVSIFGGIRDLAVVASATHAKEVFICIPSATRSQMQRILSICRQCNIPVRTLPTLTELIDGRVSQRDVRSLRIEDLLGREELRPQGSEVREIVGGQTVLVTGAGGSIGSELCRQVAAAAPEALILVEKSENSLFYIHRELKERFPSLRINPILVDTTLRVLIQETFERERPDIVFHAAAHKHVGLLQHNPVEAIRNNVLGTRNVALAASQNGTKRFVNISTDKAVSPENFMGLSKKLTELCTQELARQSGTRFMNVRFGNVAGSTGSVLRLFWEQIQKREPLQVTDPRATRYFMSIGEAVYLILLAAGQGRGGETFVLEMGDPINIYELAKGMSLMAGYAPGEDVPIHFVGLRQGEKVDEQLWEEWEHPVATPQRGILSLVKHSVGLPDVLNRIEEMELLLSSNEKAKLLAYLDRLFPDFAARRSQGFEFDAEASPKPITTPQGDVYESTAI
ncbi:MAG TPA: nucleoside-diphosphate sugar epimerase/dehydratase [Candidatus Acidoferrum sp.]|nr:nucleoside-diphosphate sugar epimerase/dehydratase [Candidatus Acidoferrum sp.]